MKVASKTTNYNFHKIDLADSPPDISLINPNWDEIDRLLKSLSDALGGIDLTSIQRQLTQHLDDMAKHNQFVQGNKKYQVVLGWNTTLKCPTMDYVEVVE